MGCLKTLEKFDPFLKKQFYKLGFLIANHPGYFIIIPILLSALFATAFQNIPKEEDPEYLFSPINGPAHAERAVIKEFFEMDQNKNYHPMREVGPLLCGNIILVTKNENDSLLIDKVWQNFVDIDEVITNISVTYEDRQYRFEDLCAKFDSECIGNGILGLKEILPDVMNGTTKLTFPFMLNPKTFDSYVFPGLFGGIDVSDDGVMVSARAAQLAYMLRNDNERTGMM